MALCVLFKNVYFIYIVKYNFVQLKQINKLENNENFEKLCYPQLCYEFEIKDRTLYPRTNQLLASAYDYI